MPRARLGFSIALVLLPISRQGVNPRWLKDEERRGKTAWPDKLQPMPLPVIGAPKCTGVPGKYFLGSVIDAGLDPDRWVCPTTLAKVGGAQRVFPIVNYNVFNLTSVTESAPCVSRSQFPARVIHAYPQEHLTSGGLFRICFLSEHGTFRAHGSLQHDTGAAITRRKHAGNAAKT